MVYLIDICSTENIEQRSSSITTQLASRKTRKEAEALVSNWLYERSKGREVKSKSNIKRHERIWRIAGGNTYTVAIVTIASGSDPEIRAPQDIHRPLEEYVPYEGELAAYQYRTMTKLILQVAFLVALVIGLAILSYYQI